MKTQSKDLKLLHVKIPRLTRKMVRIGSDMSRLTREKNASELEEEREMTPGVPASPAGHESETCSEASVSQEKEMVVESLAAVEESESPVQAPQDVPVKIIPTPRKRHNRVVEVAEDSLVPDEPRPLKIIRRRREEAPKVFETAARLFPKAMLEGVKTTTDQNGENLS